MRMDFDAAVYAELINGLDGAPEGTILTRRVGTTVELRTIWILSKHLPFARRLQAVCAELRYRALQRWFWAPPDTALLWGVLVRLCSRPIGPTPTWEFLTELRWERRFVTGLFPDIAPQLPDSGSFRRDGQIRIF